MARASAPAATLATLILAEAGDEDAEYEVWRMVGDYAWDDAWVGEESGRWER